MTTLLAKEPIEFSPMEIETDPPVLDRKIPLSPERLKYRDVKNPALPPPPYKAFSPPSSTIMIGILAQSERTERYATHAFSPGPTPIPWYGEAIPTSKYLHSPLMTSTTNPHFVELRANHEKRRFAWTLLQERKRRLEQQQHEPFRTEASMISDAETIPLYNATTPTAVTAAAAVALAVMKGSTAPGQDTAETEPNVEEDNNEHDDTVAWATQVEQASLKNQMKLLAKNWENKQQCKRCKDKKEVEHCNCARLRTRSVDGGVMKQALSPCTKGFQSEYILHESFASGSFGQVWSGEALSFNRDIVIKIVPKKILRTMEEKQSVIREQIIHRSLEHPHIIELIDSLEDENSHFFILEKAQSGSLCSIMSTWGMEEALCRKVLRELLLALSYIHGNKIVHLDIKPQNILLDKDGNVKLCDFGASRIFNYNQTMLPFTGVYGTPGYIAPELLLQAPEYNTLVDIYSTGHLLFEMLYGYSPFYPPSNCVFESLEFPCHKRYAHISAEAKDLIQRMTEKDPSKRISADEALRHPWFTKAY